MQKHGTLLNCERWYYRIAVLPDTVLATLYAINLYLGQLFVLLTIRFCKIISRVKFYCFTFFDIDERLSTPDFTSRICLGPNKICICVDERAMVGKFEQRM